MVSTVGQGIRAHDGAGKGLTREQASSKVAEANTQAAAYFLTVRYEVVPFIAAPKD
jgi:hypothetical protein